MKLIEKSTLEKQKRKNSPKKTDSTLLNEKEEVDNLLSFYKEQAKLQNASANLSLMYEKKRKALKIKSPSKNVFERLTTARKTEPNVKK